MNRFSPWLITPLVVLALFVNVLSASAQDEVVVTARVDRTTVSTVDSVTLTVTVRGEYEQLVEPQLPVLGGFRILNSSRSSQFSMANGLVTSHTVFTYELQPMETGSFTIDPVVVTVNGSTYRTEQITVNVQADIQPAESSPESSVPLEGTTPPLSAPTGLVGQDVYVEAEVDKQLPVVGEQVTYRFRFYQAVNLPDQPRLEWPAFLGFWSENLSPNRVFEQDVLGRRYQVTEVRRALFPTLAGPVVIEPATLIIPGDEFDRDNALHTESLTLDVQPLPHGAPDGFAGAVGQFTIEAWVEPAEGQVNDPFTLFIRVSGNGNVNSVTDPAYGLATALADWRVYDSQVTTNVTQEGDAVRGEKTFEKLLVPRIDGDLDIPSLAITFYDPQRNAYRQAEPGPLTVRVKAIDREAGSPSAGDAGEQEIDLSGKDIRHIKPAPPSLGTRKGGFLSQPAYWLAWVAPLFIVIGVWTWSRRQLRRGANAANVRRQHASRVARRKLSKARKYAQSDRRAAYDGIARALIGYLGDKLNVSPSGLNHDSIWQALATQEVPDDLIDRTLSCLDQADAGRYAPAVPSQAPGVLAGETEAIIAELDRTLIKI